MVKPESNLKEPDQALMWRKAFEARALVEKKRGIDATPGTSGPPAVTAMAKDYQVTKQKPTTLLGSERLSGIVSLPISKLLRTTRQRIKAQVA